MVPGDRGRYVHDFVTGGYAGVDSTVDLSDLPSVRRHEELRTRYEREHPGKTRSQIGEPVSYLDGVLDMEEGDYVLTWERVPDQVRFGQVVGPWFFLEEPDHCPYRNRRAVKWSQTLIETARFSEAFREQLGVGGTRVFRVRFWKEFEQLAELGLTKTPPERERPHIPRHYPAAVEAPEAADTIASSGVASLPDWQLQTSEDGDETEQNDEELQEIDHPFDPSRIKVRTITVVVDQLLARIKHQEINLAPDFQRHSGIWKPVNKSRLIESLLLRIPIPVFYVAADEEEHWAVVDGVQRITTINDYVDGVFALKHLEYLGDLNGRRFSDLPRPMQRRIGETQLTVNVIEPGTPPEVMFNIFRRINTGGAPLRPQEIRHALNPGPVRRLLKDLAESKEFLEATGRSISTQRMADREYALRFLAFLHSWETYATDSLDGYLNKEMKRLNSCAEPERKALAGIFCQTMTVAQHLLGDRAFRKFYRDSERKGPVSKPLFEAWSVALARRSSREVDTLIARRDLLEERFMDLLVEDAEFFKAISQSTGTQRSVRKRFAAVQELVEDLVQ